eukprot:CAMPEP_0196168360 /NCGR_PEP_ID=MMETSP0911-20130528/3171_1 /TAXON_ID=49265 /ORGANISM="Thalassiosira rotula, Strain GSO102" /LENGTH=99 /DNA_ID=CAMNT_0041434355 /DNA_START=25 /DNA_END=324 /DNA_ORIENTATION=+
MKVAGCSASVDLWHFGSPWNMLRSVLIVAVPSMVVEVHEHKHLAWVVLVVAAVIPAVLPDGTHGVAAVADAAAVADEDPAAMVRPQPDRYGKRQQSAWG